MRKKILLFLNLLSLLSLLMLYGCVDSSDKVQKTPYVPTSKEDYIKDPTPVVPTPTPTPTQTTTAPETTGKAIEISAGKITAGEWNDLNQWDFWKNLTKTNSQFLYSFSEKWRIPTLNRFEVKIISQQKPVVDAEVILADKNGKNLYVSHSNIQGIAQLFSPSNFSEGIPYKVTAKQNGHSIAEIDNITNSSINITLEANTSETPLGNVDIMFVVDTTGSMQDELDYLNAEVKNVITRAKTASKNYKIRISGNYYRDTKEVYNDNSYVVRSYPFTESIDEVLSQLSKERASGGGDYPEAVDLALDDAINKHEWSPSARTRILFLLLDALPHSNASNIELIGKLTKDASAKGITIVPIVASGMGTAEENKELEFLMRTLAISTNGTYIFLTNDSGIGDTHVNPTIGFYQMEYLNDMLVRIIKQYSGFTN